MSWWTRLRQNRETLLESLDDEARQRLRVFYLFSTVAIPVLLGFAVFNLFGGGVIEFMKIIPVPLLLLVGRLYLPWAKHKSVVYLVSVALVYTHFSRLLYVGGDSGSNIFWLLSFPLAAYVILGRRQGTLTVLASVLGTCVILFVPPASLWAPFQYPPAVKARFLIAYVVTALLSYLYEQARLAYRVEKDKREAALLKTQEDLLAAHAEIEKLSLTDSLTGCYNRHYLTGRFQQELERARRYSHPLAIALCDIDHFKRVNDNHGHAVGDQVLAALGRLLCESVRSDVDWVVRYGGEEFLIVLPETTLPGAAVVAERIRGRLAERAIGDRGIRVSVSFGVTAARFDAGQSVGFRELFERADELLYQAKEEGRNRVVSGPVEAFP